MINNNNDELISDVIDFFNQVFKGNSIDAKMDTFIVGNTTTIIFIKVNNKEHVKYIEKLVPKVSAVMDNLPMRFVKDDQDYANSYIEIPNVETERVDYDEVYNTLPIVEEELTAIPLGNGIDKIPLTSEIVELNSMLIGGSKASGKTNYINNILATLIKRTSPEDIRLVLIDPTHFEMNIYKEDPHLLCPVVVDPIGCKNLLWKLVSIMHHRYVMFDKGRNTTSIEAYNRWALDNNEPKLPYIVVVLNEYTMFSVMAKVLNIPLLSLLQKGRACGIYFIISVSKMIPHVITPDIKANLITRIAFHTTSEFDSRKIIDEEGANKLVGGSGDMLMRCPILSREKIFRIATPYISTKKLYEIIKESKEKYSDYFYDESFLDGVTSQRPNEMKDLFVNMEVINKENDARVEAWVYNQEIITLDAIQNELAVDYNQAHEYFMMLIRKGVIIKTKDPDVYKVIENEE